MGTITYIAILIAIVVGLLIGMYVSPKRRATNLENESISLNEEKNSSILELEQRLETMMVKCEELQQTANEKTKEIESLQSKVISGMDSTDKDLLLKIKSENDEAVKKLKRQLEDTEEELEDAESTVKRMKRQLEEKVSENERLIDDLSTSKRTINDLTISAESAKKELEETNIQLDSVSSSLDFVQEILKAVPLNSETLIDKEKKIDAIFNYVFFDFQELFKQHFEPSDYSDNIFGQGLSQWRAVKRKSWIEGKKTIAFIGEFSAGKTSIVNRILSQDDPNVTLLPVSAKATTAIPTYIAGGDFTTYQFYSPDGNLKGISEDSFKKVSKEILSNIDGVSKLIQYFVMTYQNPHLAGMSILDTPGFSSGDQEDAVRTVDVINECDALFWVFDVNAGTVNRSSLEVIKKNMTRPLYVIINKTDTKAPSEVDAVENLIKKAFENEGIKVEKYIRFSSKAPLDELMGVIDAIENDSSAEEYLSKLKDEFLPSLIKVLDNNKKKATKELDSSNKECDKMAEDIGHLCDTIGNDCYEAANIPHLESYLLRKNRYEMNMEEFNSLVGLLEKVANQDVENLTTLISEFVELVQNNQDAFNQKNEAEYTLNKFKDCRGKLKRLITDLNRK